MRCTSSSSTSTSESSAKLCRMGCGAICVSSEISFKMLGFSFWCTNVVPMMMHFSGLSSRKSVSFLISYVLPMKLCQFDSIRLFIPPRWPIAFAYLPHFSIAFSVSNKRISFNRRE